MNLPVRRCMAFGAFLWVTLLCLFPQVGAESRFPFHIDLLTLENTIVSSASFDNHGKPVIIIFWTSTCKPCIKEQNELTTRLQRFQKDTGVRVMAISTEKKEKLGIIKEIVRTNGWKHEFYLDYSLKLRNQLLGNWHGVPQVFLFSGDFRLVLHTKGYSASSMDKLEQTLYGLTQKGKISQ